MTVEAELWSSLWRWKFWWRFAILAKVSATGLLSLLFLFFFSRMLDHAKLDPEKKHRSTDPRQIGPGW